MKKYKLIITAFVLIFFCISSCKKTSIDKESENLNSSNFQSNNPPENFFKEGEVPYDPNKFENISNVSAPPSGSTDLNNGDVGIVLGNQLPNPYTVRNMQRAINVLNGSNAETLVANFLYIKFKPTTSEQIETLEDNEELELQDYPMDYAVVQDGDYYQDPSQGSEEINWLYTVVPVGYTPRQVFNMKLLPRFF